MPDHDGPIVDEVGDDLDAYYVTVPLEGLTEPQWVTGALASRPFSATQFRAAVTAAQMRGGQTPVATPTAPTPSSHVHQRLSTASLKASTNRLSEAGVNVRIVGAILTLASGTIAARALGVFNQSIISAHFGAGVAMDAYFATLALPVLLTNLVVNALQSSIIPIYIRMTKDGREREASEVLSTILNIVLLLVCLFTILMISFPVQAVRIMAPGASQETIEAGAQLAPYVFPILLLNTVVGFLTAISNATRRFAFPALGATLVPVGIFLGTVLLGNALGVRALALGLLGGTVLQFLMMLILTRKLQLHYRPLFRFAYPEVRTALAQFSPMLAGAAIGQANPVLDQVIASMLGAGNISVLNYALKVISIPITVIFVAYSQAIYPYFSSQAAARDYESLKSTLRLFVWGAGIVTLGIALVFAIFAGPIVDILFHRGAFSATDAKLTAATLIGFSVGLVPMAVEYMLTRTFNALQRNDLLLRVSLYTMITNAALDILLGHFLGLPGIALATSIDYLLTAILMLALLRGLIGHIGLRHPPEELRDMWRLASMRVRLRAVPLLRKWKIEPLSKFPLRISRQVLLVLAAFAVVGIATVINAVQGLRLSVGAVLGVMFLRSPLGLLLTWGALGAFYSVYVFDHSLGYVLALGSLPTFGMLIWHEMRQRRRWPLGIWAYALFLIWVLAGIQLSPLSHSQFAIYWLGDLDYGLLVVLVIAMLTTPRRLERFISAVLYSAALLALLGIAEYVLRFGGFQQPGVRFVYRVAGIYGWSNSFGFYLSLVFPLAVYRVLTLPRGRRLAWGLVLGAILCALLLTFVRTALVDVILVITVAALLLERRIRKPFLASAAVCAAAGGLLLLIPGFGIQNRLLQNLTTLNARTSAWQVLLTHMQLTAPFGQGMYASRAVLSRVGLDGVRSPHSLFLQVLFDHGVIGLLLLIASFALLIGGIIRRALHTHGHARILMALAVGGLVGGLAYVSVDNTFWIYGLGTYFWLLVALPYARVFAVWSSQDLVTTTTGIKRETHYANTPDASLALAGPASQNDTARHSPTANREVAVNTAPSVLFVIGQFLPRVGGAEVLTQREAVALRSLGHRVRIVTLRLDRGWPAYEEREGVHVRRTGGLFIGNKLRLRFGAQWLAEIRFAYELLRTRSSYDIIHIRQVSFLARPAMLVSILTRKPVLAQIASAGPGPHAPIPAGAKTTLYAGLLDPHAAYLQVPARSWGASDIERLRRSQWLASLTLRLLRRPNVTFLSVSERTSAHLIADGVRAEQIILLPTGIDTENYEDVFQRVEARMQSGTVGPLTVVCVARYRYEKGLDVLLHAWSRVRAQGINARLVLAGGGRLEAQLAAMIDALGLQDSVQLAGLQHDVRSLLGMADIFVLPSRYEGLPNALLEAMAAGLPCVATRVSGSEDIVEDGTSGMLVPPGEPEPLAAALIHLLTEPEEAQALGRAARERVVRNYERDNLMRQLEDLYERLVGRAKTSQNDEVQGTVLVPAAAPETPQLQ